MSDWIQMEAYLLGEIFDMGGADPNLHIRLVETGQPYIGSVTARKS